jgi:Leucine-rich repeat (LRR) protein
MSDSELNSSRCVTSNVLSNEFNLEYVNRNGFLSNAVLPPNLTILVLSHNYLTSTIPNNIQLRKTWTKLDLSFNKLGQKTCYLLGRALKIDRFVLAVNLRANTIENRDA